MVYYLLMAVVLVLAYPLLEHKPSVAKKFCYVMVVFVCMLYISILRYGLGNDYYSYIYHFNIIRNTSWSGIFNIDFEPGFVILNKVIALFTADTNILYAIYAVIILIPMAYVIFRYSENIWLSTVMFISLTFFYCTLSFIRQSIAFAIIFLAYKYFVQRKHFMVLLFIFFACLFHSTVVILIPLYILAVVVKLNWKSITVYGVLTLIAYLFSNTFIEIAVKILPQYELYLGKNFLTSGYNPIYIITPAVILAVALLAHFTGYGKAYPEKSSMFTSFAIFNFVIWLMSTKHFVLERFSMYPYLFMIMFIPSIVNYYRQRLGAYAYARKHVDAEDEGFVPDSSVADPGRIGKAEAEVVVASRSEEENQILAEIMAEDADTEEYAEEYDDEYDGEYDDASEEGEEQFSEKELAAKSIADRIAANVNKAVTENVDDEYYEDTDEEEYDEQSDGLTNEERWQPQNYKFRKTGTAVLDFIRHPITIYAAVLAVVLGINLWYNYFGLNVNQFLNSSSNSFHGVMPYKSIFPGYMELALSLESPEDKDVLLSKEEDLLTYLYRIRENENYTVIISSRGDPVSGLNTGVRGIIKRLGLTKFNSARSTDNYIGIIKSGKVVYENTSSNTLIYSTDILGFDTKILSSRNAAQITIDGTDLSRNGRGINIVVLDNNTGKVVDRVSFKTYYVMLSAVRTNSAS